MQVSLPVLVGLACFVVATGWARPCGEPSEPVESQRSRQEEAVDHFLRWLDEDVSYIISDEERAVFTRLATPEEKESFIEQFWIRRDPDPMSAENEFKIEHYRRIAYANERFSSGFPGWMSDRGRIYIIHGPPAEVESYPAGGVFNRPMSEGGGSTTAFPFEIWRYRQVDGVGADILLEFVDSSMSGEYRLTHDPDEKDALLFMPGAGDTLAESFGLAERVSRTRFSGSSRDSFPLAMTTSRDNPFQRYELMARMQAPTPVKYRDLREMVQVQLNYDQIPLTVRTDSFRLGEEQMLVPVTVQLHNRDLTFRKEGMVQSVRLAVYGIVTNVARQVVAEFEDDLDATYPEHLLDQARKVRALLQKTLILKPGTHYRFDLVVKDLNSGRVGVATAGLLLQALPSDRLASSSLILADSLEVLPEAPERESMFVVGDVRVRPRMDRRFERDETLGVYFQLYNCPLDQASLRPNLRIRYRLLRDGEVRWEVRDASGLSIQHFSDRRIVLIRRLPLQELGDGRYQLLIEVEEEVTGQSLQLSANFELVGSTLQP